MATDVVTCTQSKWGVLKWVAIMVCCRQAMHLVASCEMHMNLTVNVKRLCYTVEIDRVDKDQHKLVFPVDVSRAVTNHRCVDES